ncbi:hypothetical protein [Enterovirga sp. CN4-39]|uniref:hypothetical protein n=1 Tax=Enterovirga sp. CN4-39 TaxID=3400910 RepID=UPI003C01B489
MPLWFLDEAGSYVGENSTAYPAPAEMVERIRANLPDGVARVEDVPPLTGEFWHWPSGADGPQLKPAIGAKLDKVEVAADEVDHVVLTGVPAGAEVLITGPFQGRFVSDGSDIALSFTDPGPHEVRISAPGCRPERFSLMAKPEGEASPKRRRRKVKAGQEVVVGRTPEAYADEVAADVDAHFEGVATRYQAAVAMAPEAEAHLAGQPSQRIERLAAAQDTTADALATIIKADADRFWSLQEEQAQTKRQIRELGQRREKRAGFQALLKAKGIEARRAAIDNPVSVTRA